MNFDVGQLANDNHMRSTCATTSDTSALAMFVANSPNNDGSCGDACDSDYSHCCVRVVVGVVVAAEHKNHWIVVADVVVVVVYGIHRMAYQIESLIAQCSSDRAMNWHTLRLPRDHCSYED